MSFNYSVYTIVFKKSLLNKPMNKAGRPVVAMLLLPCKVANSNNTF